MTPQEEQAAMQAYVRQQLAARQDPQLNLDPGQAPLAPEDQGQFLQRPPLDVGGAPPPGAPTQLALPALTGGGYSMGKPGQTSEPLNLQAAYSLPDAPLDFSGGATMRPGRGVGAFNLKAKLKQPF